jgi:TetR/AcrR family transcriptional regulator
MRKGEHATRTKILDAAATLMTRRGFAGTSAQSVADEAGVNKALIFYYFGNKTRLFEHVLEHYLRGLHEALSQVAYAATASPIERMHCMLDAWIDYIEERPEYPALVQRELANAQGRHDLIARYNQQNFELVEPLLRPLAGKKRSPTAAFQLFTSIVGMVLYYYISAPVLEPLVKDPLGRTACRARRRHVHWLVDTILSALQPEVAA